MAACLLALVVVACAGKTERPPAPPPPAKPPVAAIALTGPYDRDIPVRYVRQLQEAAANQDQAIPYLFLSVALHFEGRADDVRALHFYDRAAAAFRDRRQPAGEGLAGLGKIFLLLEADRKSEANALSQFLGQTWREPPLAAFAACGEGLRLLADGHWRPAAEALERSILANKTYQDHFDLTLLRQCAVLGRGEALVMSAYLPRLSRFDGLVEGAAAGGADSLLDDAAATLAEAIRLNDLARQDPRERLLPDRVFQKAEAKARNLLGLALGLQGKWRDAGDQLHVGYDLAQKAGDRLGQIDSRHFAVQIHALEKDLLDSLRATEQLNVLADRYRLSFYQVWAKGMLARHRLGFGEREQALEILREAAVLLEQGRMPVHAEPLRGRLSFDPRFVYDPLVELLAGQGAGIEALDVAERAKGRRLVDLLAGQEIAQGPAEAELLRKAEGIERERLALQRRMIRITEADEMPPLRAALAKAEDGYRDVLIEILALNRPLYTLVSVPVTPVAEVQALLDENTSLLSYYVTERAVYVWAIVRGRIHLERLPLSREELKVLVSSLRKAVAGRDRKKTEMICRRAYDVLLKPVMAQMGGDCIGLLPHDDLFSLPFAAMNYRGQYLVEGFSLFQAPDLAAFQTAMSRVPAPGKTVAVFANPAGTSSPLLPFSAQEAERIRKRVERAVFYLHGDATEARAKSRFSDADLLHFAVPGVLSPGDPLDSSLFLSPGDGEDGRLAAREIYSRPFQGRAVILSGAQAVPGGGEAGGSEAVGLPGAFLYAGSPSVISTLWTIPDQARTVLVDDLYRHLLKNESVAEALRHAQHNMIRRGYAPFFWAAFVSTGRN